MHTLRARFKKDIVAEFLPPARKTKKTRVIIFADGGPSVPYKKHLLYEFSKKGFWVFHPRYRGSWESDGKFLQYSLDKDILDVVSGLSTGFTDLLNQTKYKLKPDQIILMGGSFGGPAQLLASRDNRIDKVITISPVIDWRKVGKDEPIAFHKKFFPNAFGQGYRIVKNGWAKLLSGKFYNPMHESANIDGRKIIIIHAKDDNSCPYSQSKKFAKATGAKLVTLPRGGHLGTLLFLKPRFYKLFQNFIKK